MTRSDRQPLPKLAVPNPGMRTDRAHAAFMLIRKPSVVVLSVYVALSRCAIGSFMPTGAHRAAAIPWKVKQNSNGR
jgi:hypothetical protein